MRTILVYQVDKNTNNNFIKTEINDVQLRIDDLSRKLEENKEKADLDNIKLSQPVYHRRKTKEESMAVKKDSDKGIESLNIRLTEANKL